MEYIDLNDRLNTIADVVKTIFIENDFGKIEPETLKDEIAFRTGAKERPDQSPGFFQFIEKFIAQQQIKANAKRGTKPPAHDVPPATTHTMSSSNSGSCSDSNLALIALHTFLM